MAQYARPPDTRLPVESMSLLRHLPSPRGADLFCPDGPGGEKGHRHTPYAGLQSHDSFSWRLGPLQIGLDECIEIVHYLRGAFPEITRLTCYARASTLWKAKEAGIRRLAEAGLNRVHIGLESGDSSILKFHRKAQTPEIVAATGQWLREAGIEVSFYVLLGMGGRDRWKPHIDNTARVIENVNPEFVRIRRIWLFGGEGSECSPECPLWEDIRSGTFIPQTAEGTVLELRQLLKKLKDVDTF